MIGDALLNFLHQFEIGLALLTAIAVAVALIVRMERRLKPPPIKVPYGRRRL